MIRAAAKSGICKNIVNTGPILVIFISTREYGTKRAAQVTSHKLDQKKMMPQPIKTPNIATSEPASLLL
jgi:hypothetical protein